MNNIQLISNLKDIDKIVFVIKFVFISACTYYTYIRATNTKFHFGIKLFVELLLSICAATICGVLKYTTDYLTSILLLILSLSIIYSATNKNELVHNMVTVIICLSINYVLFFIAIILDFIINVVSNLQNDYINLITMMIMHIVLLFMLFRIRRFKNGFSFLQLKSKNDYFNILILNISITIIFSFIIFKSINKHSSVNLSTILFFELIILSIIIFKSTQKTLTMYYKHKMLIKDLNETKDELDKKIKEVEKLEQENIEISKKSHSVSHKIKSLNRKIEKLMMNNEIADEIDIKDRIKEITNEYYKDKVVVELSKTGIEIVDDMLDYMKNECIEKGIDFELQLNGNIHYMTNNFVSKEELEILLADHIKDAIIAIKHSDNVNRSILVRLGMIDEFYSLYIYDSGIEFEIDTLINLGIKPVTTHADEDGTGMGFLNTFDTLKKHNASLIINEIGKPGKDNYTKVIMIIFDGKGEFKINSYRAESIKEQDNNNRLQIDIK